MNNLTATTESISSLTYALMHSTSIA